MRRKSVYDLILVVVDQYMKYMKYIPTRKDWKTTDLADLLVKDVFSAFEKPVSLMSD